MAGPAPAGGGPQNAAPYGPGSDKSASGETASCKAASGAVPEGLARSRWLSWRALRLHLALLIVVPGCFAAGWFELTRAQAGNELSWVYVFEWPFFGGFAIYLWWRLLHEGEPGHGRDPAAAAADGGAGGPGPAADTGQPVELAADPQLAAWNEYLARLHAEDPAGGPPG